ncbi:hypothetical protein [Amycolatopsis tucumanensis]|uniref:hypothetical protein n=1 Tax=Amycolatopsis tucumanensis TaxID=401106 RepID=UPI003D71F0DD
MDSPVDVNLVVFQVNGRDDDLLHGAAPARAEDAVRQAWRQVQEQRDVQASEVTRIHSTWQPSRVDRVFLAGTFPRAERTHDFDRPDGDDWDTALDAADAARAGRDSFVQAERDGEWLPILHTYDGPLKLYASLPLVDGRLYLGFAKTTITPAGRIGMSHLLKNRFEAMTGDELQELLDEACGNLARGLRFGVHDDEAKGRLVSVERGDDNLCAASAIVLGQFHDNVAHHVGEDRLIVGLVSPDHIYVAGASSGWVEEITDWVRTSPDTSGDLVPTVLLIDGSGNMEIIAERPTGRVPADATV